jgi:hypothetical protein
MERREAIKRTLLMTGVAMSPAVMSALLQGCQVEPQADWTPEFFSVEQGQLIRQVTDHILPATDTPGASDVGVPEYIDMMVKNCMDEEDQAKFMAGLEAFEKEAAAKLGKGLLEASAEEQLNWLKSVDSAAKATAETIKAQNIGKSPFDPSEEDGPDMPFFIDLKGMVIAGYFTCQEVATTQLNYDPIPGEQKGCIPLSEVGSNWALR